MKWITLCCFLIALYCVYAKAPNWANHTTGHELFVTLSNELDTIFVILVFKDMSNSPKQISLNDKARIEIEGLISENHPGVVYTEIDMSNSNLNAYTYESLATKHLGVKLGDLIYGPTSIVMQNGQGEIIVYEGNYKNFIKLTEYTIHALNSDIEIDYDLEWALKSAKENTQNKTLDKGSGSYEYYNPDSTKTQSSRRRR